jgi:hypothetical protein
MAFAREEDASKPAEIMPVCAMNFLLFNILYLILLY